MFKKRTCSKCGRKIDKNYEFCPYCGNRLREKGDWGMLGKHDFDEPLNELEFPRGLNILMKSLMRNIDKQFKQLDKEMGNKRDITPKNRGISISISTSNNSPPRIRINSGNNYPKLREKEEKEDNKLNKNLDFSNKNLKNFSRLPREEPSTNIRRLSEGLRYEIEIPGVSSTKDISIERLENSIEIKAVSKDKAYFKLIPINMPIKNYNLENGRLILELEDK